MRAGSEQVVMVTNLSPQTHLFVDFITKQVERQVTVKLPDDVIDVSEHQTTVILLDADHLDETTMREWHEKIVPAPSFQLAAFNLKDQDHASDLLVHLHLRGVFYRNDPLDRICKGIVSLFAGNLWMSRTLMTRMIELLRQQQLNAYRPQYGLTHREVEILHLLGTGSTNEKIAERLFISEYTVKSHVYNVFKKIGVNNRSQAVAWVKANLAPQPNLTKSQS